MRSAASRPHLEQRRRQGGPRRACRSPRRRARWPAPPGRASRRRRPRGHDHHAPVQVGRVERLVARHARPDRGVALGHAARAARSGARRTPPARWCPSCARSGRGGSRRRSRPARPCPAAASLAATLTASPEVGRTVGARRRRGTDRAGEHDRRLGVVEHVAQHGRLLQRVGAVGHHHADPAARGVARLAADAQLVVQRQVRAGHVHHGLRRRGPRARTAPARRRSGRRRPARGWRRRRPPSRFAGHGDRAAGGQDAHATRRRQVSGRRHPRSYRRRTSVSPSASASITESTRSSSGIAVVQARHGAAPSSSGRVEHPAAHQHVVDRQQAARREPRHELLVVVGVARLVGVEVGEVEGRLGGQSPGALSSAGPDPHLHAVRQTRPTRCSPAPSRPSARRARSTSSVPSSGRPRAIRIAP